MDFKTTNLPKKKSYVRIPVNTVPGAVSVAVKLKEINAFMELTGSGSDVMI